MELSGLQIGAIIAMVLIARSLAKSKKKKEDLEKLYPPEVRGQRKKELEKAKDKGIFAGLGQKKAAKKTARQKEIESLYPPKKEKEEKPPESQDSMPK